MLYVAILGSITCLLIFFQRGPWYPARTLLLIYFFVSTFVVVSRTAILQKGSPYEVIFLSIPSLVIFLAAGPLAALYVQRALDPSIGAWRKRAWIHFIPTGIGLLALIPFYTSPWSDQWKTAEVWLSPQWRLGITEVPTPLSIQGWLWIGVIHHWIYLIWQSWMWWRTPKAIRQAHPWPGYFTVGLLILMFFFALSLWMVNTLPGRTYVLQHWGWVYGAIFVSYMALCLIAIQQPWYRETEADASTRITPKDPANPITLDEEQIALLAQTIEPIIHTEKAFRNPRFSPAHIAAQLDIPVYQVQTYFQQVHGKPFTALRNQWRVEYAQQLLQEGRGQQLTMEAIAHEAGFSSKSNFYAVFKQMTGKSPAQFNAS